MTARPWDGEARATADTCEQVLEAYVTCALWSSTDEDGTPMDRDHTPDDIAPDSLDRMAEDVFAFLSSCWNDGLDLSAIEPAQIGHDFWLTRNGHGAGFWDRGLGELGDRLTELAHAHQGCDLYVGDDGRVHVS